jgi:hypothetical protein
VSGNLIRRPSIHEGGRGRNEVNVAGYVINIAIAYGDMCAMGGSSVEMLCCFYFVIFSKFVVYFFLLLLSFFLVCWKMVTLRCRYRRGRGEHKSIKVYIPKAKADKRAFARNEWQ